MGNGGCPVADLNLGQNSEFFKSCFLEFFVLGSNLNHVAPFHNILIQIILELKVMLKKMVLKII